MPRKRTSVPPHGWPAFVEEVHTLGRYEQMLVVLEVVGVLLEETAPDVYSRLLPAFDELTEASAQLALAHHNTFEDLNQCAARAKQGADVVLPELRALIDAES